MYGPGTETLVMDEDAQPLEEPIIAPIKDKRVEVREKDRLDMLAARNTGREDELQPQPDSNAAVAGHLHHGKTTFMDMLVEQTHDVKFEWSGDKQLRYTDTRLDEQDREVSVKAVPMCPLCAALRGSIWCSTTWTPPATSTLATRSRRRIASRTPSFWLLTPSRG